MPLTSVQSKTATTAAGTATSLSAVFDAPPTTGNLLVAIASASTTLTMSSSGWTLGPSAIDFTGHYLWSKVAGAAESSTVTAAMSASRCALWIAEFSGNAASSPLDQSIGNVPASSNATAACGTTAATTQADELAIAAVSVPRIASAGTSNVASWSDGFTEVAEVATTGGDAPLLAVATKALSAIGAVTVTATLSAEENHPVGLIATFKAAAASPTAPDCFVMSAVGLNAVKSRVMTAGGLFPPVA